jgi:hypothetical protein
MEYKRRNCRGENNSGPTPLFKKMEINTYSYSFRPFLLELELSKKIINILATKRHNIFINENRIENCKKIVVQLHRKWRRV